MKAFFRDPVAIVFTVFGPMMILLSVVLNGFAPYFSNAPWDVMGLLATTASCVMLPFRYAVSFLFDNLPFGNNGVKMLLLVFTVGLASYFLLGKIISILLRRLTRNEDTIRYRVLADPVRTGVLFLLFEGAIPVAYAHIMYTLILDKAVMIRCLAILQTAAFFMLGAFVLAVTGSRKSGGTQRSTTSPAPSSPRKRGSSAW